MAGTRTQANGPVSGVNATRVAQDSPVSVNQEVRQLQLPFLPRSARTRKQRRAGSTS